MKKLYLGLFLTLIVLTGATLTAAQAPASYLAGNWTLDTKKTKMNDLPRQFKNFRLSIAQSDNKIGIKSLIEGDIITQVVSAPGSSGGGRPADAIWGDGRTPDSRVAVKPNYGGSLALAKDFNPGEVAYDLDGQDKTFEVKTSTGSVVGSAKVKAKLEKEGKSLRINIMRKMKTMKADQTEMIIYVRERWDVSDDGKMLKYVKTVELPNATDEVLLVFNKEAAQ